MPTYDYKCSNCGHMFEEFQSMTAEPLKTCPNCKKDTLKRIFGGGAGMIFKGQGFYLTDYRKTSSSPQGTGTKKKKEDSEPPKTETPKADTSKKDSDSPAKPSSSDKKS